MWTGHQQSSSFGCWLVPDTPLGIMVSTYNILNAFGSIKEYNKQQYDSVDAFFHI